MDIIEKLKWRYAVKEFDPTQAVSEDKIDILKEAFRLSPSSFWLQPWKLFIIKDRKIREKLVENTWGQRQVVDASDLFIFARPNNLGDEFVDKYIHDVALKRWIDKAELKGYEEMMKGFLNKMTEEEKITWANKQIYIALWNVMTVAASMNIDTCPIEWFIPEKYDDLLFLNSKWYSSVVILPVGYRSESDKYAQLNKVRFDTEEIVEEI